MGEQRGGTKKKKKEVDERGIVAAAYRAYMHYKGCAQKLLRMVRNCGGKGVGDGGEKKPDEESNRKGEEIQSGKEERKSEETEDEKVEKKRSPPVEKGEMESKMSEQGHEGKKEKKKSEKVPHVSTTVLKTRLHCGRCARSIKKIINKHATGLQEVNMNLEKNQITLKGTVDTKELLPYLNTRLKQNVEVVLLPDEKDDGDGDTRPEGGSGGGEEVKDGGGENKRKKKNEKRASKPKDAGGGDGSTKSGENASRDRKTEHYHPNHPTEPDDPTVGDPNQSCAPTSGGARHPSDGYGQGDGYGYGGSVYQHPPPPGYPPNHHQGSDAEYYYAPPLQFFSDENPNSCSVM